MTHSNGVCLVSVMVNGVPSGTVGVCHLTDPAPSYFRFSVPLMEQKIRNTNADVKVALK